MCTIENALVALAASWSDKRTRRIPLETGPTKIDGMWKYQREYESQGLPIFRYNSSFH